MVRKLENWVKSYVYHTRNSESPDAFHFWTAVATVAGALRRRVWRNELLFHWTPNFYIILVGPPGVAAKSTTIRGGLSLLEQIPGIRFGPQSATWQALFEALTEAQEGVEINGEMHIMSCMTCAVSELGTFLRTDDNELVAQLISMWDGQLESFGRRTKKDGEQTARNPWLNIVACTTPSWLTENCPPSMIDGGLFSRIMFVYGDKKRRLIAYPSRQAPVAGYKTEAADLVHDLAAIAELKGEYDLEESAFAWGEEWYAALHLKRAEHMKSERFSGYLARKQGHLHKLAMVLAAAKRDELIIKVEDLEEADYYLSLVERDMLRVFDTIGQSAASRITNELLQTVRSRREVKYQNLWRQSAVSMSLKDFTECIKGLLAGGWVRSETRTDGEWLVYLGPVDPQPAADLKVFRPR